MSSIKLAFDNRIQNTTGAIATVQVFNASLQIIVPETVVPVDIFGYDVPIGPETGDYLVRAILPSGEILNTMVKLESEDATATAHLISAESFPDESLSWAYAQQSVSQASGLPRASASGEMFAQFRAISSVYNLPDPRVELIGIGQQIHQLFTILEETRTLYKTRASRRDARLNRITSLVNTRGVIQDSNTSSDPRIIARYEVTLPDNIQPAFALCRYPGGGERYAPICVVLLPPATQMMLLFVRTDGPAQFALSTSQTAYNDFQYTSEAAIPPHPRALINTNPGRKIAMEEHAESLLSFLQSGLTQSADIVGTDLLKTAESLLTGKRTYPAAASIAGYFLLQASITQQHYKWLRDLCNRFESYPDGAVLYGTYWLRLGKRRTARKYLLAAVKRGVPVFTFSLRLLRDGLLQLSETARKVDEELESAQQQLRLVSANADWDSRTTSFVI